MTAQDALSALADEYFTLVDEYIDRHITPEHIEARLQEFKAAHWREP